MRRGQGKRRVSKAKIPPHINKRQRNGSTLDITTCIYTIYHTHNITSNRTYTKSKDPKNSSNSFPNFIHGCSTIRFLQGFN